ncbi:MULTISPECIES: YybH family protein [Bradyrhizobium]|uniref:YybH family protein n=1 Tax=Bradyrhizobium TaxID=374 RepID=UPI00067EEAC5|nr:MULTISPECIES: nuclear transport factor 2 family protein [Bradyrhizobium]
MRMSSALYLFIALLAMPAAATAGDESLKQQVEKIGAAYADSFNKQDGAGIAALYAPGGMIVNPTGPHTDIAQAYDGLFKAGFNHNDITVDEAMPLGTDTALAIGEYHITGKKQTGEPLDVVGRWTAAYSNQGGNWKIRMLSAFPKAPPPK